MNAIDPRTGRLGSMATTLGLKQRENAGNVGDVGSMDAMALSLTVALIVALARLPEWGVWGHSV